MSYFDHLIRNWQVALFAPVPSHRPRWQQLALPLFHLLHGILPFRWTEHHSYF